MKLFSPKSFSWIIYGTTATLISVMVVAAVTYRKSLYWENRFNEKQIKEVENYENLKDLTLLLSNSDFENSLLITDYFNLDSMLLGEKFLNAELNRELKETLSRYNELSRNNDHLRKQVELYQKKVDNLIGELHQTRVQLADANDAKAALMDELRKKTADESREMVTVDFLARYNLIDIDAIGIQEFRRTSKPTRKVRHTDHILITINSDHGLNFDLGNKTIYFRIADPEGNILPFMKDEVDLFRFQGDEILFSEKQNVRFSHENLPLRIIYHPVTTLKPGVYWVYAFCDGIRIGEASFDLL